MMEYYIVLHRSCFTKTEKALDTQFNIFACSQTRKLQIDIVSKVPSNLITKEANIFMLQSTDVLSDIAMR